MQLQSNARSKRSGFTLIELLVVIAIIAILAAILFPVFAQAREKARAIACISNLKQIGLATMQYTQDYDETYPDGWHPDGLNDSDKYSGINVWRLSILPYVGQSFGNPKTSADMYSSATAQTWNKANVLSCPDQPTSTIYGPSSYGYNTTALTNGWNDSIGSSPLQYNGKHMAAILNPAGLVAYCDAAQVNAPEQNGASPNADPHYYDAGADTAQECVNYQNAGQGETGNCGPWQMNPSVWQSFQGTATHTGGVDWSVGVPGEASDWGANSDRRPFARHAQHINCAFADGHAKSVPVNNLNLQVGSSGDVFHDHN